MALTHTHELTTAQKTEHKHIRERSTGSFTSYINDTADPDETDLTAEDSLDNPSEADEESEDESSSEDYAVPESLSIQPLWILYEGQLLWAASHYGFSLAPKEYFRRRIQTLIDFLAKKFPRKSYGELLLSLQGFFVKDGESSKGRWLESLKNSGVLYFDGRTKKYCVIPLTKLRVDQGQGKSLPRKIEALWLESELAKINPSVSPKDFNKYKAPLIDSFKKFCAELNGLCSIFDSQEGDGADVIGLKKTEFVYEESTLDRKKFGEWKKLWRVRNEH